MKSILAQLAESAKQVVFVPVQMAAITLANELAILTFVKLALTRFVLGVIVG